MYILKTITSEAVPAALEQAKQYRLLGDPLEAESICRDVLEVDPDNQEAQIILLLALTDSFKQDLTSAFSQAQEVLEQLGDQYCQAYYGGIICERRAKVHLERGGPGSGRMAYEWFRKAMNMYEKALNSCSPGNQDAVLRWNSCARILMRNPHVAKAQAGEGEQMLE